MSAENEKVAQVLQAAGEALEKVAAERDQVATENASLRERLNQIETRLEAEKIASEMHEKGLRVDVAFDDLVGEIEKSASEGKLPVIREAVKMAAPNMGHRIGNINHDEHHGVASSDLEAFLVGNVG